MRFKAIASCTLVFLCGFAEAQAALRINGSTTVNLPVSEAAELLRAEKKMRIEVDTQGGSSGGITSLGSGHAELAMSSKPLSKADRITFPKADFQAFPIALDGVALVVSADIWHHGIRSLTAEQLRGIYEKRITNWKQLGGPARRILFFNKEPGSGTWSVFAAWLYGSTESAPLIDHPQVGSNGEARSKVAGSRGAISQLSAAWVDNKKVFALSLSDGPKQKPVAPTAQNIALNRYPMNRTLYLISNGPPKGASEAFINFMLSSRGQALVQKHGYLPVRLQGVPLRPGVPPNPSVPSSPSVPPSPSVPLRPSTPPRPN